MEAGERVTQANGDSHEEGMKVSFNEMPNTEMDSYSPLENRLLALRVSPKILPN